MSSTPQLYDNHGRPLTYLRLAVTDRCNLRCFYCMPESGIDFIPRSDLLSYEEMLRLVRLLVKMGIKKVRITGGEPFMKKDLIYFLDQLCKIPNLDEVDITTNGVLAAPYINSMKKMGINSINLSLDSLDKERFAAITRRDEFDSVMDCFHKILKHDIPMKINMVVMQDNIDDILPMINLSRDYPVDVRFIEEMPFNGGEEEYQPSLNYVEIMDRIKSVHPAITKLTDKKGSTAYRYQIPGHKGKVGVIAAFSRTFCGSCNRIRITAKGTLKTCLYDNGVLDLKAMIVNGATDEELKTVLLSALANRAKDGFEAEKSIISHSSSRESMTTIGG